MAWTRLSWQSSSLRFNTISPRAFCAQGDIVRRVLWCFALAPTTCAYFCAIHVHKSSKNSPQKEHKINIFFANSVPFMFLNSE